MIKPPPENKVSAENINLETVDDIPNFLAIPEQIPRIMRSDRSL